MLNERDWALSKVELMGASKTKRMPLLSILFTSAICLAELGLRWRVVDLSEGLFNRGPRSRRIPFDGHELGSLVDVDIGDTGDLFNFATHCADAAIAGHVGNFEGFAFHRKTPRETS